MRQDSGSLRQKAGQALKRLAIRRLLVDILATERIWAIVLGLPLAGGMILLPLVLLGMVPPMAAFIAAWLACLVCAIAAHRYRGRAILWQALCEKARREGSEFIEGWLEGNPPQVVEVIVQQGERMPN